MTRGHLVLLDHPHVIVLQVRLKWDIDFGIFGDQKAPGKDTIALIVLSKKGHRTSYCGGCIGGS